MNSHVECFANIKCNDKNSATICIEHVKIISNKPECVNSIGATTIFFKAALKTIECNQVVTHRYTFK